MATNVYDREEIISYDPAKPCHYYGWHVSSTSDDFSITGFHSKKMREGFIKAIGRALAKRKFEAPARYVGSLAFGMFAGDAPEHCQDLLESELSSDVEQDDIWEFYEEVLQPICQKFDDKDNAKRLKALGAKASRG